ncbi:DUF4254 domain-containing protein [Streptacidiphilus sp. BW17]|uniref:DUF4254 domain-containing protein n=1 Tax=Streptacidiphilus sp. BW17 TaxID=3156274 RepID=UPI003511CBB9
MIQFDAHDRNPAASPDGDNVIAQTARRLFHHHEEQWTAEDESRLCATDDTKLAGIKRTIDRMNLERSHFIDVIDAWVGDHVPQEPAAALHTETLGSVVDRICIARVRADKLSGLAGQAARAVAARRQLGELADAYDQLVAEVIAGARRLPAWRTMKSYGE